MTSTPTTIRKIELALLSATMTLALAGPVLAASVPADAWITTKVKISLATTEGVSAGDVNVDTVDRQVTLHGTVHTAAERDTAERMAKTVEGTRSVRNLLQVVPAKKEEAVEARDDVIQASVAAALAAAPSLSDSDITVQSVNKGVVLLQGTAGSLSDHLSAVRVASGVQGVRRVASEVQSQEELADANVWLESNVAVGERKAQATGSAAGDLYLTSMVKMRLLANAETPAMEINVDSRLGVVTLFGMVPTESSKAAAGQEASSTAGVSHVRNELQVVASVRQPAMKAADSVVEGNVRKNIEKNRRFGDVDSEVKNCVARLTGSVSSGAERVEAMQVARATMGVCSVTEDLTIQ